MAVRGIGHCAFAVDDTLRMSEKLVKKQNNIAESDEDRVGGKQYSLNTVAEPGKIPACSYGEAVSWWQHQQEENQDWRCGKYGFRVFGWKSQRPRCGHWWQEEDDQYVDVVATRTVEEKIRQEIEEANVRAAMLYASTISMVKRLRTKIEAVEKEIGIEAEWCQTRFGEMTEKTEAAKAAKPKQGKEEAAETKKQEEAMAAVKKQRRKKPKGKQKKRRRPRRKQQQKKKIPAGATIYFCKSCSRKRLRQEQPGRRQRRRLQTWNGHPG